MPDVTTLAKPIASGIPMGAMLCTEEAARAFTPGMHGTTFGGGPLPAPSPSPSSTPSSATTCLAHIRDVGDYFHDQLRNTRGTARLHRRRRGIGLMLGLELNSADLAKQSPSGA